MALNHGSHTEAGVALNQVRHGVRGEVALNQGSHTEAGMALNKVRHGVRGVIESGASH